MPVDTTGPFPADPTTGQRAEVAGAPYYYPDEPKPAGVAYHLIQRSSGAKMADPILDQAAILSQTRDTAAHDIVQEALTSDNVGIHPAALQPVSAYASVPGMVMAQYPTGGSGLTSEQKQIAYGQKPDGTFYKKNELWPSDQPPGTNWLDVLLGVAKAAPGGIKTYYDIQAQNAAFKATRPAKPAKVPLPSLTPQRTNWTPILLGGLALLVVGGGAFALTRRKSTPIQTKTGSTKKK